MTSDQLESLKKAAQAATPQNLDSAEIIDRNPGLVECPTCGGDGHTEFHADFCNYDGKALGVQFYGIGQEHKAAEAYFRAASPAAILALIERVERADKAVAELRNIAEAKRFDHKHFECDVEFADWVQSRARHTLRIVEGGA